MRTFILLLLISLCVTPLIAQPSARLGAYDGMGFTKITYDFFGKEHDRGYESYAVIGLATEIPVAEYTLLSIRAALTKMNAAAGFSARVTEVDGSRRYTGMLDEQWIVEVPVLVKFVQDAGRDMRTYWGIGGFLDINSKPADVIVEGVGDPPAPRAASFSSFSGGLMVAAGLELNVEGVLIFTPELAIRQPFTRQLDAGFVTFYNNPRFLFSVGILFSLSPERWRDR
ncbi:hypothetical protein KQI65_07555 [bacterium]|nr:hypothetical protein [bacterium]